MLRYIGSEAIAATPSTSAEPRVRSQSVMKAGGPAGDEIGGPGQQRVVHDGRTAQVDPANRDIRDAELGRMFLDELVLLHHEQRQEADAARAGRDADFGCDGALPPQAATSAAASVATIAKRRERSGVNRIARSQRRATKRAGVPADRAGIVAREFAASASSSMLQHLLDQSLDLLARQCQHGLIAKFSVELLGASGR